MLRPRKIIQNTLEVIFSEAYDFGASLTELISHVEAAENNSEHFRGYF